MAKRRLLQMTNQSNRAMKEEKEGGGKKTENPPKEPGRRPRVRGYPSTLRLVNGLEFWRSFLSDTSGFKIFMTRH